MRITDFGHAGMFIETAGGSTLCDPVVKPSFFGSWFVFPDNRAGHPGPRFREASIIATRQINDVKSPLGAECAESCPGEVCIDSNEWLDRCQCVKRPSV